MKLREVALFAEGRVHRDGVLLVEHSTLKTFVLQNRRVERKDLVEAPFTQLHPRGVRGVFTGADLEEVVALAEGLVA